ncbi:NB-ARC domain-containing protein [Lentzea sp. NPDC051838]|uniref:NB-ARC domain-containing protein n=1 Tax=Lentzea sp. NPDC051838 TaxID=3154849 RepID=UPI00342DD1D1
MAAEQASSPEPAAACQTSNLIGAPVAAAVQAGHVGTMNVGMPPEPTRAVPRQLPAPPTRLVNRDSVLAELTRLTGVDDTEHRPAVVVLSGISGVGKTAAAVTWAHSNKVRFVDGQLYADLADYRTSGPVEVSDVLGSFLLAFGVLAPPPRLPERVALFRTMTADARVLVVLDDVDDVAQVRLCMPASSRSAVIATSRARLSGLVVHGAATIDVEPFGVAESVALLRDLSIAVRSAAEDELQALAGLCDGLPVALVVVGALLHKPRHWPPSRLVDYLSDEGRRLRRLGLPGAHPLQALFDAVASQLTHTGRRLYRVAGLHPGPDFEPHVVAAATGMPVDDVEEGIEELCEANLVRAITSGRYRMHGLIKLHARNTIQHDDVRPAEVLVNIVGWYRVTAGAADLAVMGEKRWRLAPSDPASATLSFDAATAMQWFETERANLLAAVQTAAHQRWDDLVWQLCESLWASYHSKKHYADSVAAHELAVAASRRCGNGVAEARMLNQLARAQIELGEFQAAETNLGMAKRAAETCGDFRAEAAVLESLGVLHRTREDLAVSVTCFRASLELNERIGDDRGTGLQCYHLGDALLRVGDPVAATELLLRAVHVLGAMDDVLATARAEIVLGAAHAANGLDEQAQGVLLSAASTMRARGQHNKEAEALRTLAEVARKRGESDLLEETLARLAELSGP